MRLNFFKKDEEKLDKISHSGENGQITSKSNVEYCVAREELRIKRLTDIIDYIEIFVFAIAFVIILFSFFARVCTVSGDSMMNTLVHGEKLIVSDIFYEPERGDIIVFHQTGTRLNEPVVKRVIALEGETVIVDHQNYTVTIIDKNGNEFLLDEEYMLIDPEEPQFFPEAQQEYVVGKDQIFVMGDNRDHSNDSRKNEIGLVDERRILGKVVFRLSPLSRFGSVY